jgi:dihydrofolate reductase
MYITEIDAEIEGDTFFPEFDTSLFSRSVQETYNDAEIPYSYVTYTRIRN